MGRVHAEARMTETIRFYSVTGTVVNPTTLVSVDTTVEHYNGPARVHYPTSAVQQTDPGNQFVALQDLTISIPASSAAVPADAIGVVSASTTDASLVGRKYRVKGAPAAGQVTAHRFPVEEIS
jgi:hypothetical protein